MPKVSDIIAYCDELLNVDEFRDYAPNGLQVEGKPEIEVLVSGVTASQALIGRAVALNADMLLVHHGYFWKGEDPRLIGMKGRRVKSLMQHDINLVGYHLPLDGHPELGNNAQLGRLLGLEQQQVGGVGAARNTLFSGVLAEPMTARAFARHIASVLGREPMHICPFAESDSMISRVAWCTGGAQGFVDQAAQLGVDAYISGEISERTTHEARECGIHYYAAGHHATERYGAMALGEHLAERFDVEHHFIDIDNPA